MTGLIFGSLICILALFLIGLSTTGAMRGLARRPAVVLGVSVIAGAIYQSTTMPIAEPWLVSDLAGAGLAVLAFVSALQFKVSRLPKMSPTAFRLATIAAPVSLLATTITAFILLSSVTIWAALLIAAALMLNGSAIDRRAIISAPAPVSTKSAVRLESAVAIALGLPIALMLESAAVARLTTLNHPLENAAFGIFTGFAIGGALGLLAGRFGQKQQSAANDDTGKIGFRWAVAAGLIAFCVTPLVGGNAIIAAGAVGLMWSEESRTKSRERRLFQRKFEETLAPAALVLFGFTLGPRVLEANFLTVLFALMVFTFLRVMPRLVALRPLDLSKDEKMFMAWFGGAPGAASALFLVYLLNSVAFMEQEQALTVGATAVIIGVICTRLSSRPMASYFVKQAVYARRRKYYSA